MNKQILVRVVDGMAHSQPFAVYAEYPYSSTSCEAGFRKVTYADFANVINGLAWKLKETLGPGEGFPTLAYIGPNDLRYAALTLACVKVGYKLLLTSPRNSIAAHQSLFNATACRVLLHPSPTPVPIQKVLDSCSLRSLEIPSHRELLSGDYPHYSYTKSFAEARGEPLVVLHTSGTTGLPRHIIWTHDFMAATLQCLTLTPPEGFINDLTIPAGVRMFVTLPPFHAAGVMSACLPILYQTKSVYPPASVIPSARVAADALRMTTADLVLLAPPFVEEMCMNPEILDDILGVVDSVFWVGGPIPKAVGDELTRKTKLWTMIGMTEASVLPTIRPINWPYDDWQYVRFHPEAKVELRHYADDLYEAVIVRHPDPDRAQPCFKTFPDLQVWSTKDLYSRHPSEPELWLPRGRADDIIVFLTGEKTNPISMEQTVAEHPEVSAALVIGRLRFEAALLIELITSEELSALQRAQAIERIWPFVDRANQDCPRHAQVSMSRILFTAPHSPMLRSGKGTIQRQPTLDLYADEIDKLYRDANEVSLALVGSRENIDLENRAAVLAFVRHTIHAIPTLSQLEDGDDFFQGGMDSLQALRVTRALKQGIAQDVEINSIYTNPSIWQLTNSVMRLSDREDLALCSRLGALLTEYTDVVDLIAQSDRKQLPSREDRVVLLTGSTGGLGCFMLQALLEDSSVSHVYCLNRSTDSASLQARRSRDRGLPIYFPHRRVTFLTWNLSQPKLGLHETYGTVLDSVTDIIHSAWPVNFNLGLDAFRPHLEGICNLLSFAYESPHTQSLFFLSSISSVAASGSISIPERALPDLQSPAPTGYGRSKYLAECILDYAAYVLPSLDIRVARVGQVAGPAVGEGVWNRWEWLPSLVISSRYLGVIPTALGGCQTIDWIPIDALAPVLIELALGSQRSERGATFFHLSNPKPTTWAHLLPFVIAGLGGENAITEVSFTDWLQRVRSTGVETDPEELGKVHPAIKLVKFYESLQNEELPTLEMQTTLQASQRLRNVQNIQGEMLTKWVKGWMN